MSVRSGAVVGTVLLLPVLFLWSLCADASAAAPGPRHLLITEVDGLDALRDLVLRLEREGAVVRHLFPPNAAIGSIPPMAEARVPGSYVVLRDPGALPRDPRASLRPELLGVWESLVEAGPPTLFTGPSPGFGDDALPPPADEILDAAPMAADGCLPFRATSGYFVGDVSLGIVLPESSPDSPDSETWDAARQDEVIAEIVQGAAVLSEQVLPWAGLDFVYDVQRSVPVDVEPIEMPSNQAMTWAREALTVLGHPSAGAYVRHLRDLHGTDWAVAAFIADDLNDPDNRFADGQRFAFAYLGGPALFMTYDNDGWSIDRMDTVFAHELGHSFHALDEYAASEPRCTSRSGIFGVENQNAAATGGCLTADPCIMRAGTMTSGSRGSDPSAPLLTGHCRWTLGHIGAWDEDGDDLADVRDVPPRSWLDPVLPHPVTSADIDLTGSATALPDPDEIEPDAYPHHTLNRLARVEYRLDGGAWTEAAGSWGEVCADFQIELVGLSDGWHTVEARAVSALCEVDDPEICDPPRERAEPTPASVELYVNTDCTDDLYEENDRLAEQPSVSAGWIEGLQICAFDLDRFGVFLREGAALTLRVEYDDPAAPLALVLEGPSGAELGRTDGSAGVAELTLPAASTEGRYAALVSAADEAETPYRLLVDAECVDDALEPNGEAAAARELVPGDHRDLQICDGDEDWYVLGLGAGADLSASMQHQAALGDLDLALLDANLQVIDESATPGDIESVEGLGLPGGRYYLRVRGAGPSEDNRYDLIVALDGCLDDARENDDTPAEAGDLVSMASSSRVCPWDEDWHRIEVPRASFLRVEAFFDSAQGDLDLELRTESENLVGASYGGVDAERIDLERALPGSYLVRVTGRDGDRVPLYDLQVQMADPILLKVGKRDLDVLLDWSNVGIECYVLRRNDRPDTFAGGLAVRTGLGAEGEEAAETPTHWDDVGAIEGTRLWFYDAQPTVCSGAELQAWKSIEPYPNLGNGGLPSFTIRVHNAGLEPLSDVRIVDQMPVPVSAFTVDEIPPGATDLSQATGGDFGRGWVEVLVPGLEPGETAEVRGTMRLDPFGTPNQKAGVLRNQGRVTARSQTEGTIETVTDDPATLAWPDSTDVFLPSMSTTGADALLVRVFWNQDVDLALRVEDPCGNLLGSEDASSGSCDDATAWVSQAGGCGDPWPWGWAEAVQWNSAAPPSGRWKVSLRYVEDRSDGGTCLNAGPEDAVVLLETSNGIRRWEWLVLDPGDRDWREVFVVDIP